MQIFQKAFLLSCSFFYTSGYVKSDDSVLPPVLIQMARDPAVHEEIQATQPQVDSLLHATDAVDGRWIASRSLSLIDQQSVLNDLTSQLDMSLGAILSEEQRERLRQIEWQALGVRAILTPSLSARLRLDPVSLSRMRAYAKETDSVVQRLEAGWLDGQELESLSAELRRVQERERKGILSSLAPSQQKAFAEALGEAFDFTRVRRTYPRAPELVSTSVESWITGSPVAIRDVRGKAIVVHFFTDQFAGCRENMPFYNRWAKDFGDKGVVVVGIFTPFSEDRRDVASVRAALEVFEIRYPVLFDADSANWNAWGNRTWPTVYLIDGDGFLRNFWEGELQPEGNGGDQEFRQWIQEAIDELAK